MALEGYFLFQGDRTVCGGKIITGAEDTEFFGRSQARESDKVTCGKHPGIYRICGGMGDMYEVGGKPPASRLHRKLQLLPVSGEIHSARFG